MKKIKCYKCGKEIEGYNKNHVDHLMQQHMLKHSRNEKNNTRFRDKNKKDYPDCPRCKTNVNVVKNLIGYRCIFCDTKITKKGQQTLK